MGSEGRKDRSEAEWTIYIATLERREYLGKEVHNREPWNRLPCEALPFAHGRERLWIKETQQLQSVCH